MELILAAYTEHAYKKISLPRINDSDYETTLSKDVFNLKNHLKLKLDVIGNQWSIYSTDDYSLIYKNQTKAVLPVDSGLTFVIRTSEAELILIKVLSDNEYIAAKHKIDFSKSQKITIGLADDNDIVYKGELVSKHHAEIFSSGGKAYIKDMSSNGTFLNTKSVKKCYADSIAELSYGDSIDIYGLRVMYLGSVLAVTPTTGSVIVNSSVNLIKQNKSEAVISSKATKKEYYNRSPRIMPELFNDDIEIEEPPRLQAEEETSLLSTIAPSFTMVIPMMMSFLFMFLAQKSSGTEMSPYSFIGIVTAVSSALIGVFWGVVNFKKSKKNREKRESDRFQSYSEYLRKTTDYIKEKYEYNTECIKTIYPSAAECMSNSIKYSTLWNRNLNHQDFLYHRVGLGNVDFQSEIYIPKKRFNENYDNLAYKPEMVKEKFSKLHNVPVGIDLLSNRIIGIVGGNDKDGAVQVVKNLAIQVASCNCYTDVKLCFCLDSSKRHIEELNFVKWLPHVWSEEKKERYYSGTKEEASDVFYNLTKILRLRAEQASASYTKIETPRPIYILVIEDISLLENELISKYIFESREEYGLTTILLSESYEELPNNCECIVFNNELAKGIYNPQTVVKMGNDIVFDTVDTAAANIFARTVSNIEVSEFETGGELANSLSFLDMYHVERVQDLNVIERWRKNRTFTSMKALIGQKAGGTDCYLDIHEKYHGPHGLVAGTTGSGKSETLQTYILSLAVNFSPNDVAFFMIDFKGGGMANLFASLPHMAGQISNLSGNQIRRAMVSIKSENLRRQRIFTEAGVNNINNYTRLYKNNDVSTPVPHLFIIIDEFAELKREEPEFMKELISVAQVGRSLGVHLILATQKPSGTVDDNIRSNSKFKLCLRVQDKQDSTDMIAKPDAAYLTQAGRCFLQVGNDEIFELFQSGWSGATYDENLIGMQSGIANLIVNTGKAVLTSNKTLLKRKEEIKRDWIFSIVSVIRKLSESGRSFGSDADETALATAVISEISANGIDFAISATNIKSVIALAKLWQSYALYGDIEAIPMIMESAKRYGIKLPEIKEKTQLDAVVEHICTIAKKNSFRDADKLWLPALGERIFLESVDTVRNKSTWSLGTNIGLCDDPVNQAQFPYSINFSENGNLAIYGGVASGKSTFMQTLAWSLINKYTPEELNIYALDFSNHMLSCFENSAHFGGIMYETDPELISKFVYMMGTIFADRKNKIRGGSFNQYVNSGNKCPAIVIMIDNYAAFREKTEYKYDDFLFTLARDGAGFGIYLVISASGIGMNDLPSKIADTIKASVAMDMGDKMRFAEALGLPRIDILPEINIKGRGLVVVNSEALEFQSAIAFDSKDDYTRGEQIAEICETYKQSYKGKCAKKIPSIPAKPVWGDIESNDTFAEKILSDYELPFAYNKETADIVSIDLRENFCTLISGAARTGRTNALKVLIGSAKLKGANVVLIDKPDKALQFFANKYCDTYITEKQELFNYLKELMVTFKERNLIKRELIASGCELSEINDKMLEKQRIFIFISDISAFNELVYSFSAEIGNMSGFVENVLSKGANHNIYIIADAPVEQYNTAISKRAFSEMVSYKTGIYLGGNISSQRMFDFSSVPFQLQSKALKAGEGFMTGSFDEDAARIVIPFAKGMV